MNEHHIYAFSNPALHLQGSRFKFQGPAMLTGGFHNLPSFFKKT